MSYAAITMIVMMHLGQTPKCAMHWRIDSGGAISEASSGMGLDISGTNELVGLTAAGSHNGFFLPVDLPLQKTNCRNGKSQNETDPLCGNDASPERISSPILQPCPPPERESWLWCVDGGLLLACGWFISWFAYELRGEYFWAGVGLGFFGVVCILSGLHIVGAFLA